MGFYLRKSFKMGPVRMNLSKSGIGMSAGVKGARIGVSGSGRGYVHAGRKGLYYRQSLGSTSQAGSKGIGQARSSDPIVIYEDTGVTYASSAIDQSAARLEADIVRKTKPVAVYLLMPMSSSVVFAFTADATGVASIVGTALTTALLIAWPVPMLIAWRKNRTGSALGKLLDRILSPGETLTNAQRDSLSASLQAEHLTSADRDFQCRRAYLKLVLKLVEDRRVTGEELTLLDNVEQLFKLPNEFTQEARADAYREVYLEAIADEVLTEAEEQSLRHIREALDISESAIRSEMEVVERLREVREIQQGELPTADPSKPIQKSELCHYEAPARTLKEKNLKSFQSEGQKYKVRGLVVDKEGQLFVTNKRLLLVHAGTTSIRLDKILDLEVDYDRSLLMITKDGAKAPVLITTPDAFRAGAIVAGAAGL